MEAVFWCLTAIGILLLLIIVVLIAVTGSYPGSIKLNSSHVLISGGSSGIGLEIAKYCYQRGSNITIMARNKKKLGAAQLQIENSLPNGGLVQIVALDISDSAEEVNNEIEKVEARSGPVDILINCAGISHAEAFQTTAVDKFSNLMKVNYLGSVHCCKAVVPGMVQRRKGRIAFVSSQAGQVGVFGFSAYSASKFALRGLAETLQLELRPHNIGITISFPPDTDTEAFHIENENKPEETRLISETAGLFSAEYVAKSIVKDVLKGNFMNTIGMDGFILGHLSAGMAPCNSILHAIFQVYLMGIFRIISLCYLKSFDCIVAKCAARKSDKSE